MPRWNGGVIGAANNPTSSSAKGIWSLSEATKAIRAGLWPPSNAGADPYFENVTLLLPGDGTNGAQNNTFLDSSTNNFTITRNGNTTQGTFSPFSKVDGRWGAYFDGTGDYLSCGSSSSLSAGSGDFTIEFWANLSATGASDGAFWESRSSGANSTGFALTSRPVTGGYQINFYTDGAANLAATTIAYNTWTHIAVSRSGSSLKVFVNGVVDLTLTKSNNFSDTPTFTIGQSALYSGSNITGYLSNFRLVKGTAVYTSAFTPTTSPLSAITNTSLLTCQSNRFKDNSTNAFAITRNGDVAVTTFSPFPTMTAYAAGTNGGSGYFDNSGDYLTVGSNAAYRIESNSTWTFECWLYPLSLSAGDVIASNTTNGSSTGHNIYLINGVPRVTQYGNAAFDSTATLRVGQWTHLAIVCNSNALTFYVNGTSSGTATWGSGSAGGTLYIGAGYTGGDNFDGYISGMRYVVGSTQVPSAGGPTSPPTAVTNTALLLNFTNGGIIDTSMSNDLETVGNAQISTTQSKWGGASMYFNPGETNPLIIPNNQMFNLSSGNFTIEFWVYLSSDRSYNFVISKGTSNAREWGINVGPSTIRFYWSTNGLGTGDSLVTGSASLPTSTWMHIAVTRSGNDIRLFKDGTQVGSTGTFTSMYSGTSPVYVGRFMDFTNISHDLSGYLDDLRITKGVARYTSNFTAPSGPFNGFGD